jgi:hypothetical protein
VCPRKHQSTRVRRDRRRRKDLNVMGVLLEELKVARDKELFPIESFKSTRGLTTRFPIGKEAVASLNLALKSTNMRSRKEELTSMRRDYLQGS